MISGSFQKLRTKIILMTLLFFYGEELPRITIDAASSNRPF
ncbi:MAG: hypothetical protein ABSH41_20600 [Syntrophobacteraceae bacterium]